MTGIVTAIEGHSFTFDWSPGYIASLAYLTIFGSIVAFGAYLTLLGRIGAHKAGYAMVMFPVIALILSSLFEGLEVDAPIIVGATLVLAGNLFVLGAKPPRELQYTRRFGRMQVPGTQWKNSGLKERQPETG